MRRGGAGKSILPLTYYYTSDCISDVSLINNSPDTPNTRAMRDMKSLPKDFSIYEAGFAEKERKNIIPFQVMSRISGNELLFSFLTISIQVRTGWVMGESIFLHRLYACAVNL